MSTTTTNEDTKWIEKRMAEAIKRAKAMWGTSGWERLTPEMRNAYVCQHVVGAIAAIDFADTYGESSDPAKLLARLVTIGKLCDAALQAETGDDS